jgi:putative oxidoreductase
VNGRSWAQRNGLALGARLVEIPLTMRALERFQPVAYDLLRFFAGALFSVHGMQKIFGFMAQPRPPVFTQMWVGGVIELLCGILIALGLFTRLAAFIASGEMAVAFLQFHFKGFANWNWLPHVNGGELPVLYCFIFLYLATRGSGRFGLDAMRSVR